jgi:hypothetical protein
MNKKLSFVVFMSFLAVSCAMPMTPQEYRDGARKSSFTRIVQYTVPRPFKAVFEDVKSHSDKCLNVHVRKGTAAAPTGGTYDIQTNTVLLTPHSSETGMRINKAYYMVVDLEAKGRSATEVTAYGAKMGTFDIYFDSFASWAKGEKPICPEF